MTTISDPSDGTADDLRGVNPWHPMRRPIDLKHLGKLLEELGEAGSAASRCVIQGIDACEPVTGKVNREWLEDELADVLANADLVIAHFALDRERMAKRVERKKRHLRAWHAMLAEELVTARNFPHVHAAIVAIERDNGGHLIGTVYPGERINLEAFEIPESHVGALPAAEAALAKLAALGAEAWETFVIGEQSEAEEIERAHGLQAARKFLNDWFDGWED